jgi:ribosomal protein L28
MDSEKKNGVTRNRQKENVQGKQIMTKKERKKINEQIYRERLRKIEAKDKIQEREGKNYG